MVNRYLIGALLVVSASLTARPGEASELSYTFLDFGYVANDIEANGSQEPVPGQTVDGRTESGDGISIAGSVGIGQRFYFVGAYRSSIVDVSGLVTNSLGETPVADNFDYVATNIGFGFQKELRPNLDFNAELTYDHSDYDFGSFAGEDFDTNDGGAGAKAGLRWNPSDPLEVTSFVRWSSVGKADLSQKTLDADTLVGVGLTWYFIEDLGLGVNYETGNVNTLTISMRFSFGRLPF